MVAGDRERDRERERKGRKGSEQLGEPWTDQTQNSSLGTLTAQGTAGAVGALGAEEKINNHKAGGQQ